MNMINSAIKSFMAGRLRAIDRYAHSSFDIQNRVFKLLMANKCDYLSSRGGISSIEQFQNSVPIVSYDDFSQEIDKVRAGQGGAIWRGSDFVWAAKSSGTTGSASKYIPINKRYLKNNHYKGAKDIIAVAARNFPDTKAFKGRALTLGGSAKLEREGGLKVGDLSAILIENAPFYAGMIRSPKSEIALIPDFEKKVDAICRSTVNLNVTSFAGVPSWNLVLMNKILEYTGKNSIDEVWPNMSFFIHGGIAFEPYRKQYEAIFKSPDMRYMETYNASEGFFAMQDDPSDKSMLLMLDYDIFYEFLPMATLDDYSTAVPLEGVKCGVNYAMIITTTSGLWRYMIGDTVEFTSVKPYKIKITGRTKSFINAFGEEVIVDNAEQTLKAACEATDAIVAEYTAAPIFMDGKSKGAHQWVIEFAKEPNSQVLFDKVLDERLQEVNSDYQAKRFNNTTLNAPTISVVEPGTFVKWMQSRGKMGGQNKVPRLSGKRDWVEQLLELSSKCSE